MTTDPDTEGLERADLLETLAKHRGFLLQTVNGLTDEQAARHTTASELCLGGILKHLALVEQVWVRFIVNGPAVRSSDQGARDAHQAGFRLLPGETLAGLTANYNDAARRTDDLIISLESLDASQPLPKAPWFEPGARWSARRVILHIIAETSQHAGHADIIRESLDGAKTMC